MKAEDLVLDESCEREIVEEIGEVSGGREGEESRDVFD